MAGAISFDVDTSEITAAEKELAALIGKYDKITAIAMTQAAKAAKAKLAGTILPQIQGGPTPWTRRGLRYWRADRDRLVAAVGWNYGDNSPTDLGYVDKGIGVPSGRYMGTLSRGGDRRPKSSELAMRRAGVIRSDQFITPATEGENGNGVTLDSRGNLPGAEYQRILSRIKAAAAPGYTSNATGSRRSRARRSQSDFFVRYGELGEGAKYVARRIGDRPSGGTGKGSGRRGRPATTRLPRGFIPALFVVDQPNYDQQFRPNIQAIALAEYRRIFPGEFRKALWAEHARQTR